MSAARSECTTRDVSLDYSDMYSIDSHAVFLQGSYTHTHTVYRLTQKKKKKKKKKKPRLFRYLFFLFVLSHKKRALTLLSEKLVSVIRN